MVVLAEIDPAGRVGPDSLLYVAATRARPHMVVAARLTPLENRPTSLIDEMIADGRIAPARREWRDIPKPLATRGGEPLSQVLQEMRDEERW